MILKRWVFSIYVIILFLSCFLQKIFAQKDNPSPAITVINLIRGSGLGHENDDLVSSLRAQWQVTRDLGVNATWLMQYSVLEDQNIIDLAKNEMSGQEFGLLLEIDRNSAQKANILYRGQGAWYFSDGLFLVSYDVNERRILIDKAFSKFKQIFGYYPKTVGAWWVGGDSLSYMQKKYGITAALRASDQFNLDFYSFWGTPWSIPYIASKTNEAIPAESFEDSSKVVILQWAARDPLEGYADPLFSVQDYPMKGYGTDYVNYLAGIFLTKPFHTMVMGLENGGTEEDFNKNYRTMLLKAKELEKEKKTAILFVKDFARHFLEQRKVFPYTSYFLSQDYDSDNQSFWYVSENYRASLQKNNDSVYLVDLRDYSNKIEEDFSLLPNSQSRLRITTPEIIDSVRFPDSKTLLKVTAEPMRLEEHNNEVLLYTGNTIISSFRPTSMKLFMGENKSEKVYDFGKKDQHTSLRSYLFGIFSFYFLIIFMKKKNMYSAIRSFIPLTVPLIFASSFLTSQSIFLFDSKETVLFTILFLIHIPSIFETLVIAKILPFIILIVLHFFSDTVHPKRGIKILYYIFFSLTTFLYFHLPYFPLDKSTSIYVIVFFVLFTALLSGSMVYMIKQTGLVRNKALMYVSLPVVIGMVACTVMFSRSKLAITRYEINSLQAIKNSKKNVIYVEQFENSIRPIYKAIKPLLYNYFQILPKITNTKWEVVARPANHILQLTDYDNRLIVIPKYLGSDISEYEIQTLKIKKIFDNAQILIFEKI